jgi:catechol 2,3-dioxygenase-like lactoylglutathione lyase family enzyme
VARVGHLNLTVADVDASIAFYAAWFGFEQELARYEDGTVFVTDANGFELAFHAGASAADDRWHFGFLAATADEVLDLAMRLEAAGVPVVDRLAEPGYTGFKCRDPDGYVIEVYHEPRPARGAGTGTGRLSAAMGCCRRGARG